MSIPQQNLVRYGGLFTDAPTNTKFAVGGLRKFKTDPFNKVGEQGVDYMKRAPLNRSDRFWANCFDATENKSRMNGGVGLIGKSTAPVFGMGSARYAPDFQQSLHPNLGFTLGKEISVSNRE